MPYWDAIKGCIPFSFIGLCAVLKSIMHTQFICTHYSINCMFPRWCCACALFCCVVLKWFNIYCAWDFRLDVMCIVCRFIATYPSSYSCDSMSRKYFKSQAACTPSLFSSETWFKQGFYREELLWLCGYIYHEICYLIIYTRIAAVYVWRYTFSKSRPTTLAETGTLIIRFFIFTCLFCMSLFMYVCVYYVFYI